MSMGGASVVFHTRNAVAAFARTRVKRQASDSPAFLRTRLRAWVFLLPPVAFDDADAATLQTQRVAAKFGDDREAIDLDRVAQVGGVAERHEVGAAASDLQGPSQDRRLVLEAVPGDSCAIVETDLAGFGKTVDECTRQDGVLERGLAFIAAADEMHRPRVLAKPFANSAEVDDCGDKDALGGSRPRQGPRAIRGRQDDRRVATPARREVTWRVAEVEAGRWDAATLAGQEDLAGRQRISEATGLVEVDTRTHVDAAGG